MTMIKLNSIVLAISLFQNIATIYNENIEVVYLIILTWKSLKTWAVVMTHIIDPILQLKIIDWELLDHVY